MRSYRNHMGGTVSFRRLLTAFTATLALGLATAGTASATTVWDYEYSGTFIDGTAVGKPFTGGIGAPEYDEKNKLFYVPNSGEPGWVTKLTPAGAGVNFSALGSPIISMTGNGTEIGNPQAAVDYTGGPNDGNVYVAGTTGFAYKHGFFPDGTVIPEFRNPEENLCGIAVVPPDGKEVMVPSRNGNYYYELPHELIEEQIVGDPGFEPGVKKKWSERGKTCKPIFDTAGDTYGVKGGVTNDSTNKIVKVDPDGVEMYEVTSTEQYTGVAVDSSNDDVFTLKGQFGAGSFEWYDSEGRKLGSGFGVEKGPYLGLSGGSFGAAVDPETHDVWVANRREYAGGIRRLEKFVRVNPHVIPGVTAIDPGYDDPNVESVILRGTINPDGVATDDCYFEWGATQSLGSGPIQCIEGDVFTGSSDQTVTAKIAAPKGKRYYYKLFSKNVANGQLAASNTETFIPQDNPKVSFLGVERVNTDGVRFLTEFDPNGGNASFHFEYGTEGKFQHSSAESDTFGFASQPGLFQGLDEYKPGVYESFIDVTGLEPGTTYEYRVVVSNEAGPTALGPQEFTTYVKDQVEPCPNAQVRQQTESSLLPDCRAYELVTARNTGGYDVISDIVPGQDPLDAYPRAQDSLLYSVHFGLIPGISGSPTNLGRDPYVATRTDDGWTTRYEGLPSDGMADEGAFGSPLLGADSQLSTFAFGGPDICDPCYSDGSTNIPVRLPDDSLVKGMAGSTNPAADPVGVVRKSLSADGSHLVFGSDEVFESSANSGSMWIYSRDLESKTTELVSTGTTGAPLAGEVAGLDVSDDGSRVLVGKYVGEDGSGNERFDLYMHLAGNPNSILVADTPNGVLYNGMTADGSQVFFTTRDPIAGDGDLTSADLFRADVGTTSPAPVSRISTGSGGTGNTDLCTPITDWNVVEGGPDCSTVAIAGGGGVASEDGTVFFLSPEKLDGAGNGTDGQANLYVVRPGDAPHFVATIDSSLVKAGPQPPNHPVAKASFVTGLFSPEAMTVDQSNGDVYVIERTGARLARYDSTGAAKNFSSADPWVSGNRITGLTLGQQGRAMVAVDNAPGSPFNGSIYVKQSNFAIGVYAPTGAKRGTIEGFGDACGVAVNQATGTVYVADRTNATIWRLDPLNAVEPVSALNYTKTGLKPEGMSPCGLAADTLGNVYAAQQQTGPMKRFKASDFAAVPPTIAGAELDPAGRTAMVDPTDNHVYVNTGLDIGRYDPTGALIQRFASPTIGTNSRGVAINAATEHVYAPNGETIIEFGVEPIPYEPINNPAPVHGVEQAGVRNSEDFQVTPDGRYAVFVSVVPLTGYQNLGFEQIFRYDSALDEVKCVSCAPTGAVGGSDIGLSSNGLNVTDDGRVFFTTLESFALRDTNERLDAYQWTEGTTALISTGIGQDDSGLLSVSADGVNAFFFTREVLSNLDENGRAVKVYVARANGGFPFDPPRPACAASDECHGPGTQAPPTPNINTQTGSEKPNLAPKRACPKGKVKKKGKCVKKKRGKKKSKRGKNGKRG